MYKVFDIHTHTYPPAIADKAVTNLNAFYEFASSRANTIRDTIRKSRMYSSVS